MRHKPYALLFCLASLASGVELTPDSLSLNVALMQSLYQPIDTLTFTNTGGGAASIDSIYVRFLNGDSADFAACADCSTGSYDTYHYRGWVYGTVPVSLGYVRDSLYLLQDSAGDALTYGLPAGGAVDFPLNVIVNCPVCGRMPQFPSTTRYEYVFVMSTGERLTFRLKLNETSAVMPHRSAVAAARPAGKAVLYSIQGQVLGATVAPGVYVGSQGRLVASRRVSPAR